MQLHELPNTDLADKLEAWAGPRFPAWEPVVLALTQEAISRLRQQENIIKPTEGITPTDMPNADYFCINDGEAIITAAIRASAKTGMSNADYLALAAVTAKPTPDGLRIPANLANKIEALLMDFRDTAMQLEALKKAIFYGEDPAESVFCKQLTDEQAQVLHAVLGMIGETSEMVDCFSNNMDGANRESLVKELGDHRWYEAILLRLVGITQEEIHDKNIAKLKARYGDKFSAAAALARVDVNPHIDSDFDDILAEDLLGR